MRELENCLLKVPENERRDALEYYMDYFAEAGIEDDMLVPGSLGTPKQVADKIIAETSGMGNNDSETNKDFRYNTQNERMKEYGYYGKSEQQTYYNSNGNSGQHTYYNSNGNGQYQKDNKLAIAIILLVVFSPLWIAALTSVGGVIIGIFAALVGCGIGFGCAAFALIFAAFLASNIAGSVILVGLGLLFAALTLGCIALLVMFCGQFMPWLIKMVINLCKSIVGKKEQIA